MFRLTAEEQSIVRQMVADFYRSPNTELEFKFSSIVDGVSHQGVSKDKFRTIMDALKAHPAYMETGFSATEAFSVDVYRKILDLQTGKTVYQLKRPIRALTFASAPVKIALSLEKDLYNPDARVVSQLDLGTNRHNIGVRFRNRYTFKARDGTHVIDMTTVTSTVDSGFPGDFRVTYELEMELMRPSVRGGVIDINRIMNPVVRFLRIMDPTAYGPPPVPGFDSVKTRLTPLTPQGPLSLQQLLATVNHRLVGKPIGNRWALENKPVNLKRFHLQSKTPFAVTNKYDGVRFFLVILKEGVYLVNSKKYILVKKGVNNQELVWTILDGEMRDGEEKIFWAFDALAVKGKDVTKEPLFTRFQQSIVDDVKEELKGTDYTARAKPYFSQKELYKSIEDVLEWMREKSSLSLNDGIIFQPIYEPYKNTQTFKYKFPNEMSIDFQLQTNQRGMEIHQYTFLVMDKNGGLREFTGTDKYPFESRQMVWDSEDQPRWWAMEKKIVEFAFDPDTKRPVPLRVRADKTVPNYITVAESVWEDVNEPLTTEELISLAKEHHTLGEDTSRKSLSELLSESFVDIVKMFDLKTVLEVSPEQVPYKELPHVKWITWNLFRKKGLQSAEVVNDLALPKGVEYDNILLHNALSYFLPKDRDDFIKTISDHQNEKGMVIITVPTVESLSSTVPTDKPIQLPGLVQPNGLYVTSKEELVVRMEKAGFALSQHQVHLANVPEFSLFVFKKVPIHKVRLLPVDEIEKVNLPFTQRKTFRMGTISDGSCFFHAVLAAIYPKYPKLNKSERKELVVKIRKNLAAQFTFEDWAGLSDGNIARTAYDIHLRNEMDSVFRSDSKEIQDQMSSKLDALYNNKAFAHNKELFCVSKDVYHAFWGDIPPNKKKTFYKTLLRPIFDSFEEYKKNLTNCSYWVTSDQIEYISNKLKINVFFIDSSTNLPYTLGGDSERFYNEDRASVVLYWVKDVHYELVMVSGKKEDQQVWKKMFLPGNGLVQDIRSALE